MFIEKIDGFVITPGTVLPTINQEIIVHCTAVEWFFRDSQN